jgi:hypothetical protein
VLVASADNTVYENTTGSLSNGLGEYFFAGKNSSSNTRRALVVFDVPAAIGEGSVVTCASLELMASQTAASANSATLHRLVADWGEGSSNASGSEGSGAPSTPGDATWIHAFFDTVNWATPGGDFSATSSASALVSDPGPVVWESTPELVADVQSWVDDPGANFGWAIRGDETGVSTALRFVSKDSTSTADRPSLVVNYIPGSTGTACGDVLGDINADGTSTVVDVQCGILTALWELTGGVNPVPDCTNGDATAADLECNGTVDVVDVQLAIQYVLDNPLSSSIDEDGNGCPDSCE